MKVENKKIKVGVLLGAILIFSFLGVYFYASNSGESDIVTDRGQTFLFVNPVFAESLSGGTTFLEEEAGMSIYVNVGQPLDLSAAQSVYKTVEEDTSDYVIGSFSLPDLPESDDVHCFVHKDGWIVVYYLKNEPISKIIDWSYYTPEAGLTKTKLEVGLEKMALVLGVTANDAKYYNFQYVYSDKWMIIIESHEDSGDDSFNIKIPGEFTVYERSWSHYAQYASTYYKAYFELDGTIINHMYSSRTEYGQLTAAQLSPDVFHNVNLRNPTYSDRSTVSIVLAYQEP